MQLGDDRFRVRGEVSGVAIRGPWIAVATPKTVALFDRTTGVARWRIDPARFSSAFAVAISHDLETVAIGEFGVRIVDARTGAERWSRHLGEAIRSLELSADDTRLLVGGHQRAWLFDPRSGEEHARPLLDRVRRVALGGHGIVLSVDSRMVSVGEDGVVHDLGPCDVFTVTVTRGGTIARHPSRVRFMDLDGTLRQTLGIEQAYEGLEVVHPAGDRVAMRHENGEVWLLDDRGRIRVLASATAAIGAVGAIDDTRVGGEVDDRDRPVARPDHQRIDRVAAGPDVARVRQRCRARVCRPSARGAATARRGSPRVSAAGLRRSRRSRTGSAAPSARTAPTGR